MTISDCNELLTEQSRSERDPAFERFRVVVGAKNSDSSSVLYKRRENYLHLGQPHIDHSRCFTKNRQGFIFDNPYYGIGGCRDNQHFIQNGWRFLYVPPQMSTYLVGITFPRLIAPPNSKINLLYLLELLEIAQFRGNEVRCPVDRLSDRWKFDEIAKNAEISKQLNMLDQENPLI